MVRVRGPRRLIRIISLIAPVRPVLAVAASEELNNQFLKFAESQGLDGLKGHRSVGGMRASLYNAFPPEGVDALVEAIQRFESQHT